jgi:hypothetical protein
LYEQMSLSLAVSAAGIGASSSSSSALIPYNTGDNNILWLPVGQQQLAPWVYSPQGRAVL